MNIGTLDKIHQEITLITLTDTVPEGKQQVIGNANANGKIIIAKQIEKDQHDQPIVKQRLKSKARQILIGLIISLSALMFGYSLKQITSVKISTLVSVYGITISPFAAQSILIGILPFGSMFGAIITKLLIKRFKRLSGIYIFTLVNIVAVILINITTFTTAITGRFLEGICIGHYTAISPIYLREIAPKQLRRMLGLFFSFGKIIGVIIVIIIELVLEAYEVEIAWRLILSLTAVFSSLQAVLIFLFGSDTPTEMIEKGKKDEALQIIKKLYQQKYVDEVLNEYTEQYQAQIAKGKETMSQNLNENRGKTAYKYQIQLQMKTEQAVQVQAAFAFPNFITFDSASVNQDQQHKSEFYIKQKDHNIIHKQITSTVPSEEKRKKLTFQEKRQIAFRMGVHLCIIRHFIGGNALVTQGGSFITIFDPQLGKYTSLIINGIQFIFIIIGLIYLQAIIGKKTLFLLSISLLSLLDLSLVVAMIYENELACMMIMCIYMVVYGASFISPIWAYPSQVIPASQSLLSNIMHWLALALSTLIPPIITGVMPHGNPYPVFIFFGIYGFISFLHVKFTLRETDGLSYKQIIKSYK